MKYGVWAINHLKTIWKTGNVLSLSMLEVQLYICSYVQLNLFYVMVSCLYYYPT